MNDAPALGYIQVTSWRSTFRNIMTDNFLDNLVSLEGQAEDWKKILADAEQVVFVAEMDNKRVGYAWAQRINDRSIPWESELVSLHLLPEYKHQKIGRRLFATAAKELKGQGCKSIYCWVIEENYSARKFYEALGGQFAGRQPIELGDSQLTEVAYSWKDINQLEIVE